WAVEGVELNPQTAAFAARATGLPIHQLDVRELAARERRFAAVTLIDVLEHVPEPVQVLAALHGVLAPDGWLCVKVPHGANQLRKEQLRARLRRGYRASVADNLVHVNHFSPSTLRAALARAGFSRISVEVAPPEHGSG